MVFDLIVVYQRPGELCCRYRSCW